MITLKELYARINSMTSHETHQGPLAKLRRDLGEVFVAAVADPATIGMLLSADGTLWQERLPGYEWRPIETMTVARAEEVLSTITPLIGDRTLQVTVRLDGPPVVGQPYGLNCVCCRPAPLQAAPDPLFRLCWRKMCMIRSCLMNAVREELRTLKTEV
jgi:hypothetical protein